ncbi:MAG: methylated-DNA--[Erysipelotrichaceae bacterium]|nr:methylated-DNA--[protein]-cysteine S-methyltransferase [Erysipelotrichaceae bacterium]
MNDDLAYAILAIVSEIPEGKVLTYGQIAKALGREKNARLVGTVMSHASYYGNYPCHRVVNHQGRTAPGFDRQKELLEREGVTFKENDCVDLKKHRWDEIG